MLHLICLLRSRSASGQADLHFVCQLNIDLASRNQSEYPGPTSVRGCLTDL